MTDRVAAILGIADCEQLCSELYSYFIEKRGSLNELEEEAYLLLGMLPDIEMEGFADLFYQRYSLRECAIVENSLRKLGLGKLAGLFGEAKSIYLRGRIDITQEEYEQLAPFMLDEMQGSRFDAIGDLFVAHDSEIYLIPERLCQYLKAHAEKLISSA